MSLQIGKSYTLGYGIGRVKIVRSEAKNKAKAAIQESSGRRINFGDPDMRNAPGTEKAERYCSRAANLNEKGFNANTLSLIDWECIPMKTTTNDMVKQVGSEWFVFNEEGGKKLSKGYQTKAEAVKRLGQIEYFKHQYDRGELLDSSGCAVTDAAGLSKVMSNGQ
jgi:hypothetical protein